MFFWGEGVLLLCKGYSLHILSPAVRVQKITLDVFTTCFCMDLANLSIMGRVEHKDDIYLWLLEFRVFLLLDPCHTKVKESSLPYYFPILEGGEEGICMKWNSNNFMQDLLNSFSSIITIMQHVLLCACNYL